MREEKQGARSAFHKHRPRFLFSILAYQAPCSNTKPRLFSILQAYIPTVTFLRRGHSWVRLQEELDTLHDIIQQAVMQQAFKIGMYVYNIRYPFCSPLFHVAGCWTLVQYWCFVWLYAFYYLVILKVQHPEKESFIWMTSVIALNAVLSKYIWYDIWLSDLLELCTSFSKKREVGEGEHSFVHVVNGTDEFRPQIQTFVSVVM